MAGGLSESMYNWCFQKIIDWHGEDSTMLMDDDDFEWEIARAVKHFVDEELNPTLLEL